MAANLATTIAADVRFLSPEQKSEIRTASPVPLSDRLAELHAFQGWMDHAHSVRNNPFITRAHVLSQNYICFVYLPEACFRVLSKMCPNGSATKKCAQFLSNSPFMHFATQLLMQTGCIDPISEVLSIGLAKAATKMRRSKSLKSRRMILPFGKYLTGVWLIRLIRICSAASPTAREAPKKFEAQHKHLGA